MIDVWEERAIIVASGASLAGFDFRRLAGLPVIAVNRSVLYTPARYWVTVNPEKMHGLMCSRLEAVRYFCAVPDGYGRRLPEVTYLRRIANGRGPMPGLSEDPGAIHSGNSSYGALGLAYLMGVRKIAFLGLDGGGSYHYDANDGPKDLSHLPDLFASALPQLEARGVEVVNGSPRSTIECFPKMTSAEAVEWILN